MECSAMRRGYFRGFTASEKTELWDRWQRGESLKAIGRAFGKSSSSIYFQLAPHGGIRPPPRRRARLALTLAEREEISRAIALDQSARSIARLLGRSPSSVSRPGTALVVRNVVNWRPIRGSGGPLRKSSD